MRRSFFGKLLLASLFALGVPSVALAEKPRANAFGTADEVVHVGDDIRNGALPLVQEPATAAGFTSVQKGLATAARAKVPARKRTRAAARAAMGTFLAHTPVVGETRNWVAVDFITGQLYRKEYTLRGIGEHIEVWVASERRTFRGVTATGTDFPDGDCRNGVRTQVTDAQVQYLVAEFDNNIYPKESAAFSVPPARDGSHALVGAPFHPQGDGDNIVVLIDNVRDENFYDTNNVNRFSYVAGFFSSTINQLFDRNVMTIDAFDWLHRTGANPPHEPSSDPCTSAPARPFLYEGVFAHEYQHLLMQYEDGDEVNWVNEGLSDWAQTLTGYADPAAPITQIGFDSHVQCFLGWLGVQTDANPIPRETGGPENSLTVWEDQGDDEILCDYGAAYTMMEFLAGRYGTDFMTALHRLDANGLAGLQEALLAEGETKTSARDVLHDWALMVAVDGLIDDGMRILGNWRESAFTTPTLDAAINWNTPEAYSTPGAPPNGSDYVRLRDAAGNYLSGAQIESLSFQGATALSKPVAWTVDPNPPFRTGNPALYSGAANNRDEAIVREITVGRNGGATLTFDALWNEETGWDFGFVQVSTDGGATYTSIACTDTTTDTDPDALPTAKENVPGFTGYSGGWKTQTCSLAAYAGQTVLLAFRAFNDPAVLGQSEEIPPGFWVDNVRVGTTLISDGSSLAGWRSFSEVRPTTVENFLVRIVSIDSDTGKITVTELPLTAGFTLRGRANVQKYIDKKADFVGAIVTFDDPTETVDQYAPYRLTVNGVVQPGGGM